VGSGLILLVIVGAWLAVLVPIALRSHESSNTQGTVDAFHDAMRVLSRRESVVQAPEDVPVQPRLSPAARRRRLLLVLLAVVAGTLVGAVVGPGWLLVAHLAADVVLVGYLGHLRHLAVLRRERERRARRDQDRRAKREQARRGEARHDQDAQPVVPAQTDRRRVAVRVAGVPDRMPSRATVGTALYSAPVAADAPVHAPARGAQGAAWDPVPVPLPGYLTAPAAPRRRPSPPVADPRADDVEELAPRKRAVND
jgi:hypothetical protein